MKSLQWMPLAALLLLAVAGAAPAAEALAAAPAAPVLPYGAEAQGLLREFLGEAEAVKRSPADLEAAIGKVLDALVPDMSSGDLGRRELAQVRFSRIVLRAGRPGAEADRGAICKAIARKLGPEIAADSRAWLLRQLQWIGKAESVPALAALLADKDDRVRDCARRALQANPSEEAAAALRGQLSKADSPEWRVAVLNALGGRRDAAAVGDIAPAMKDTNEAVAVAAAAALGQIGGAEAAGALSAAQGKAAGTLKTAILDSLLLVADRYLADGRKESAAALYVEASAAGHPDPIRAAAVYGLVKARGDKAVPMVCDILMSKDVKIQPIILPCLREIPGTEATKAFAALLPKLAPAVQVGLLGELAGRGDPAARPAVLEAAKSLLPGVAPAAYKALGAVGEAGDVVLLAQAAGTAAGVTRDAARGALAALKADGADKAILGALDKAEPAAKAELLRALAARRTVSASSAAMKLTEDADAAVRIEALHVLAVVGDDKAVGLLIAAVGKAAADDERDAAEDALAALAARTADKDALAAAILKALAGAAPQAKAALLRPLVSLGTEKALAALRSALNDPGTRDAAVRALADWPTAAAAPDLLALAQNDPKATNQIVALRGYIRLVGVSDRPPAEKVSMYKDAMGLAKRGEEKRLILGPLGDIPTVDALRLAASVAADKGLTEEAAQAVGKIAVAVPGNLPDDLKPLIENIAKNSKNRNAKRDAENALKKFGKKR